MSVQAYVAVAVVVATFLGLASGRLRPYLILMAGLGVLLVSGILGPKDALMGFSNPGLATVAALYVVVAGLKQTGVLARLAQSSLGRPRGDLGAQLRLMLPVIGGSAFLNNTPVVAMLIPVVVDWTRSIKVSASKLLIPLSYFAILGGLCTLIGTSTNLIVNGLLIERGHAGLQMFDITPLGLACAFVGSVFLMTVGRRLLPNYPPLNPELANPREYVVEMRVQAEGPLVGSTIEQAGLRHLPQLYLMEIQRRGQLIPVVSPEEVLEPGDQLMFVGVVDSVIDLQGIGGLEPSSNQVFKLASHRSQRVLSEAVVGPQCPIVGKTIREGEFRTRYNAVVIAVARDGERIRKRIGDIRVQPGDALLIESLPSFINQNRNARDFFLVSRIDGAAPPNREQAGIALLILFAMVGLAATGTLSMLQAAVFAAGAMLVTRCCSEEAAFNQVDFQLLIAIGAAFGLGRALESTGAAGTLAQAVLGLTGDQPWLALLAVYLVTAILTEFVTNNAAAVIMFPIALEAAELLQVNPMPFVIGLMIAASASFATPLGYQTNLMVYGAGSYRLTDFLKVGVPMAIVVGATAVLLAPLIWPF